MTKLEEKLTLYKNFIKIDEFSNDEISQFLSLREDDTTEGNSGPTSDTTEDNSGTTSNRLDALSEEDKADLSSLTGKLRNYQTKIENGDELTADETTELKGLELFRD